MWGQHHNLLKELKQLNCVDAQGNEQSGVGIQVEVDSAASPRADEQQQHWKLPMSQRGRVELPARPPPGADEERRNWAHALPRPLSQYPLIYKWAEIAAKLSESGKPIETAWAWPALAFEFETARGHYNRQYPTQETECNCCNNFHGHEILRFRFSLFRI